VKLVVLAAGQGTRLRPLTDLIPKCMVPLRDTPLLKHQIDAARSIGVSDIHVVAGYREDVIQYEGITKHINHAFATTNMVSSLFAAETALQGDVVISYGDIVYRPAVLTRLIQCEAPAAVVVDEGWRPYWAARMDDPLSDAETMKLNADGTIAELGKKANSYDEIQGQYIGLIKFASEAICPIRDFYHCLDRKATYEGNDFDNMYMTTFLQLIADQLMPIQAVKIMNGWIEVDCPDDLNHTEFLDSGW